VTPTDRRTDSLDAVIREAYCLVRLDARLLHSDPFRAVVEAASERPYLGEFDRPT